MKKLSALIIIAFITITINAQTTKQKLDSIVFQDYQDEAWITWKSYVYSYDDIGNQTQEKFMLLNEDGGMDIWKQMDYKYYSDHSLSQYTLTTADEYSYPEIREVYKENMDYNIDGLIEQRTISWKKHLTSEWELENKINYMYDEFNNVVSVIDSTFDFNVTGEFEPSSKDDFTYNTNNKLITHINSDWWNDEYWREHDKYEYSYNDNGELTQKTEFNKFGLPDWKDEKKTEYTYDESGNNTQELIYSFFETEGWVLAEKLEFSYDSFNNRTQYLNYSWSNNDWIQSQKTDWNLNTNYAYEELINPFFSQDEEIGDDGFGMYGSYNDNFNSMLTNNNISKWNSTTESWTDYTKSSFYYSETFLNVSNLSDSKIRIYPNPASSFIEFDMEDKFQPLTFKLFDLNGKLVLRSEITSGKRISVRGFTSGMYFYQLTTSTNVIKGKVILQ